MKILNYLTHDYFQTSLIYFCLSVSLVLLSGCSYLGVGQSEFSCTGMKTGVKCMSASEVYALTNQSASLNQSSTYAMDSSSTIQTESDLVAGATDSPLVSTSDDSGRRRKMLDPVPEQALTPSYRTEAKVMRIWIAPWEDTLGDLHQPSYLMTEIESRRWQQGVIIATPTQPNVIPLRQPSTQAITSDPSAS